MFRATAPAVSIFVCLQVCLLFTPFVIDPSLTPSEQPSLPHQSQDRSHDLRPKKKIRADHMTATLMRKYLGAIGRTMETCTGNHALASSWHSQSPSYALADHALDQWRKPLNHALAQWLYSLEDNNRSMRWQGKGIHAGRIFLD
jgi:hypothetical protein